MLHYTKTTDQIFDDIIYSEQNPSVPRYQQFLHETIQLKNNKPDRDNCIDNNADKKTTYVSPFRSNINPNYINYVSRLKNEKFPSTNPHSNYNISLPEQLGYVQTSKKTPFARDITFPQFLKDIEKRQTNELNIISEKERKFKYMKDSQKVITINNENLQDIDIIDKPIDIKSVPKIPYHMYSNKKSAKEMEVENPYATPDNPEMVVLYNDSKNKKKLYYSKEIFDNIQYDKKIHKQWLENQMKLENDKYGEIQKDYEDKSKEIEQQMKGLREDINKLNVKNSKLIDLGDNQLVKQYFTNISQFNEKKLATLENIERIKYAIDDLEKKKDSAGNVNESNHENDSFDYETVEEIAYI